MAWVCYSKHKEGKSCWEQCRTDNTHRAKPNPGPGAVGGVNGVTQSSRDRWSPKLIIGDVGKSVNYLVPTPINKTVTEIATRTRKATALRSSPNNNTQATTHLWCLSIVVSILSISSSQLAHWSSSGFVVVGFCGFWILSGKWRESVWEGNQSRWF